MKYSKKRLSQDEQIALMDMAGLLSIAHSKAMVALNPLLELIPGGKRDFGLLKSLTTKLFDRLCDVTPEATLRAMLPSLKKTRCRVGVPLIGHEDMDAENGWVVSYKDLTTLTSACYDRCLLCDKCGADISKCKLRRVFKNLPSPDEPEPMGGGCGYKRILMEGGDRL